MSCLVLWLVFVVAPIIVVLTPTADWLKWLALIMAVFTYALAIVSALPEEADIPPLHFMLPFLLWSVAAWRHWFHPTRRRLTQEFCLKCGHDLTGNTSGICPECGESI
jgi:hypothetical protein